MGGIIIFRKLYSYITGKSVKQRICICIVLTAMLTLLFFTVKANFFDTNTPQMPNTSISESAGNGGESETEDYKPPSFHISLIDSGVLLAVIAAYSIHKIREKRKQGRL